MTKGGSTSGESEGRLACRSRKRTLRLLFTYAPQGISERLPVGYALVRAGTGVAPLFSRIARRFGCAAAGDAVRAVNRGRSSSRQGLLPGGTADVGTFTAGPIEPDDHRRPYLPIRALRYD